MANVDSGSWKQLAERKEREWREILESRIESLEVECKEKEKEVELERGKFQELKDHFKYNLKLLEERDRELEKYDASFSDLRASLNSKNAEISELKIHLDDLKTVIKREAKTREELQTNYQRRLREKQAEIDQYKNCKDGEIEEERKEYEQFRRNLQRQMTSVQNELDTQKRELVTEFENAMKKREHEFRIQSDSLNAQVLEHELKAKLLEKELELSRESQDKSSAVAEEAELSQRELEKLVKQKEWELADTTAIKDSQIAELQSRLNSCEAAMKTMQEDFQRKYTEMNKLACERKDAIERAKTGYLEREQALQSANQELQSKLEDAHIKERQLTWANQDLAKEKEQMAEKLQAEVSDVKERWNRHVAEISRENVNRDLELGTALEEQRRLKLELEQRKEDLERYKLELKAAAEREEKLDKAKTQAELDWQRRCEDLERQQYDKAEDLIQTLTTGRHEAQALVKERERELHHKTLLVKSLHRERDQLRALLKKHGIPLDNLVRFSLDQSEGEEEMNYVEDLQRENEALKQLIGQMRLQMEALGQDTVTPEAKKSAGNADVLWYQEEVSNLRQQNHQLREKLQSVRKVPTDSSLLTPVKSSEEIMSQVEGNLTLKNHILALNNMIGTLRSEKVDLAATVKKQQTRIAFLEHSLEDTSKLPRQKQIQIDQLNYQLNNHRQRHEGEVTRLKNQVSELELQLSEARREADEYHRASLERNEELVAIGNQLSALKLEMAESHPSINFGAQELYIQQLQNELSQLRKRTAAVNGSDLDSIHKKFADLGEKSTTTTDMKLKLRTAAARIVQLARENQQLTESNNRLRAELKAAILEKIPEKSAHRPGLKKPQNDLENVNHDNSKHDSQGSEVMLGRLSQLEKLQYQLTLQELQFVQRFKDGGAKQDVDHGCHDNREAPGRDGEGNQPLVSRDTDPQLLVSMSSGGGDSLQKVWQMLEESNPSAGPSTPRSRGPPASTYDKSPNSFAAHDGFHLEGHRAPSESKLHKAQNPPRAGIKYAEKLRKPQMKQSKLKVRNYNVKDDSNLR